MHVEWMNYENSETCLATRHETVDGLDFSGTEVDSFCVGFHVNRL